jgi:hypothetical protein
VTITTPVYCTRADVKRALDIKLPARENWRVDRAIQSGARNIDGHLHRKFYPEDKTVFYDWPNFQRAYPWRIWFDASELADVTVNVPVVTSGGSVIPAGSIFWGPWNYAPPFTYLELDRSTSASFGQGQTPQRDVSIAGTTGYSIDADPAGSLAAVISSTTSTTVAVTNSALATVGHILIAGTERMIVSEHATADTGQTIGSGGTTNLTSDQAITVQSGAALNVDEVLVIGAERMLVVDITGNIATVIRAWDGSTLDTHTPGDTIYAYRSLTVVRGALGTTAATHSNGAALTTHRPPLLIRDLNIAEAGNRVLQETGGYAEDMGEGGSGSSSIGAALPDLWDECETAHGRKARSRVV